MSPDKKVEQLYTLARDWYAEMGVDTEQALKRLRAKSLSIHCWQGDDVQGFEPTGGNLAGSGLAVTGAHSGRARNITELQQDLGKAYALIPGRHRLNLHAMYGITCGADRNALEPAHFQAWIDWARTLGLGLDFNSTLFSHPAAADGFTLSSKDEAVRRFWVEHVSRCRGIAAHMGRELGTPCIHNLWIPDGEKDVPVDRWERRDILRRSLDEVFKAEYPAAQMKDALESKLWGIGSESFVAGSHEFYLGYALKHGKMVCLDTGHFHPTESVADKVSAMLQFSPELLLHLSRGVRWDSDHVLVFDDSLAGLFQEIVLAGVLDRVHLALDYFDAGMNRVGAWVLGARAALKALLAALLLPVERLKAAGEDRLARLTLFEQARVAPLGVVWDYYCVGAGVPPADEWLAEVQSYGAVVESLRA
jgi:L-rhamnose isomerase